MTEKSKVPLPEAGRSYIKKLIRVRRALIAKRINTLPRSAGICDQMDKLLNYWPYDTSEKMAYFFLSNSDNILYIMPSQLCKAHRTLMEEYEELHTRCLKAKYNEFVV